MLTIKKATTLTAQSVIDGVIVVNHSAAINTDNPDKVLPVHTILDATVYRDNRTQIQAESAEFEDVVYALQAEMIAETPETESE